MNRIKPIFTGALILMLLVMVQTVTLAQSGTADVRIMHAVPGVSAVDVYTDGQLTVSNLDFGKATGYIELSSGSHSLSVTPAGITTVLWEQQVSFEDGSAQTLIASSIDPLRFDVYGEDLSTLDFGSARLMLIHAVADGPTVSVALGNGNVVAPEIVYGDSFGTFDLPSNVYEFAVIPAGGSLDSALIGASPFALNANTLYMLVVYGTPSAPATALLSAAAPGPSDSGAVSFAHTVVGAPAVDVLVNDSVVAPSLNTDRPTDHILLPIGEHTVTLRAGGTDLASASLTVNAGDALTVAAVGSPSEVSIETFAVDTSLLSADTAIVNVINGIPGDSSVSVALADGTGISSELAFGTNGSANIAPSKSAIDATIALGESRGSIALDGTTLYGGVVYNIFVLNGDAFTPPHLVVAGTSLMQGVASAPGSGEMMLSGSTTDIVTSSSTQPETSQVATPEPTQAPAVVQAPTTTTFDGPTARVVLDPGANLQLRIYPDAESQSLGLAPSGTVLAINGREGAEVFGEDETPPADLEDFVDPAIFLPEDEDIVASETWLNVVYSTPDGGSITAWVNAQYLEVRDDDGVLMKLRELPMYPRNWEGEAVGTAITPPPIPENRVTAIVMNLNPGVNLNVRRTPTTEGEVLARIPNGTVTEFIGISEDGEWVFVNYLPAEGGSITGWVGALYVRYEYNGRDTDLVEIEQREMLEIIDEERRGEVGSGASVAPLPTPDPLKDAYIAQIVLDPGSNLHLRISPDATAESVDLVPAGTQVVVDARTVDSEWLQVTFEGQTGWISSAYVRITYNGLTKDIIEIPVLTTTEETESN